MAGDDESGAARTCRVGLCQFGCEYAQRLLFGEPMSAERARTLVSSEKLETAR